MNKNTSLQSLSGVLGVDGVPKLVDSNLDAVSSGNARQQSAARFWILLDSIETTTLRDLANQRALGFGEDLIICLKLINLIKEIHNRAVVHRKISPQNILINYDDSMGPDQINVCLIDFDCAWIEQPNMNDSVVCDPATELRANPFYQAPQFEARIVTDNGTDKNAETVAMEQRSPTIDTSAVCAVLFWLLTKREPKCSRMTNGQAPHQLEGIRDIIDGQIKSATG